MKNDRRPLDEAMREGIPRTPAIGERVLWIASSLDRVWHNMHERAGLDGLRLHGLRHNYASVAVSNGEALRTVSGLLGHRQMVTTMGYAHLAEKPIMAAARRMTDHLADAL